MRSITSTVVFVAALMPLGVLATAQTPQVLLVNGDPSPDGQGIYEDFRLSPVLNDVGQLATGVTLTAVPGGASTGSAVIRTDASSNAIADGRSGIALTTSVPEPTSAVLLVLGSLTLLRRRRADG